jgi:hypothetical protein
MAAKYAETLGSLARLNAALAANAEQLPHLEGARLKLAQVVTQALEVSKHQGALKASKQELSKELNRLTVEGARLATGVRILLKEHYGIRAEKLAEFGLQPFRGRKTPPQSPEPTGAPTPAGPTPTTPPTT